MRRQSFGIASGWPWFSIPLIGCIDGLLFITNRTPYDTEQSYNTNKKSIFIYKYIDCYSCEHWEMSHVLYMFLYSNYSRRTAFILHQLRFYYNSSKLCRTIFIFSMDISGISSHKCRHIQMVDQLKSDKIKIKHTCLKATIKDINII